MEKTFETPAPVRLYVENEVGLVAITATETGTTVVSLEAETPGAQELVDKAVVECRPTGKSHIVAVRVKRLHGMRFIRRNAVAVRVEVPVGSDVKALTGSAGIDITGPITTADLSSASGDITADDVIDDVVVKTASGDVTLGAVGGELRAHSASGDVRCSSVAGSAVFATASGDLEVGAAGDRVEVKATSGNVRLGEVSHGARIVNVSGDVRILALGEGALHVRSVSGDVSVGVVRGVALHVDVETLSGTVRSDFSLDDAPSRGSAGTRLVDLSVRSVSGNVEVERALEQVA